MHLRSRAAKAIAAWRLLCQDFSFSKRTTQVQARIYKSVIEAVLLHGCVAFGMSRDDWSILLTTQNLIQRTFIKVSASEPHERWVQIHSTLKQLRERRKLSDATLTLREAYSKLNFSKSTHEIVYYRGSQWQMQHFEGKPKRKLGRPPQTLESTIRMVRCEFDS